MKPGLRETLIQYQTLIRSLTGNNVDETGKKEILDIIAQDNNAERGAILVRNWDHVRWHTEWNFWTELLALVEPKYNILSNSKFTSTAIDVVVHGSRNKNYHYGIAFNIGRFYDNDIEFKIERGREPLYYGFPHFSTDEALRLSVFSALRLLGTSHNEWWTASKYSKGCIDFQSFNNATTLQLTNPEKRQKIIV